MAKYLVTGGAGFIGSNIISTLLEQNAQVVCLDNFMTGKRENIEQYLSNPDFTLITGDIRDLDTCHTAVAGVDYVLHQAALGSVPRSIENPILANACNVDGTLNMLVAAKDAGVKRFVYASSSAVYGDSPVLPKVEANTGRPLSPYAITKSVCELYAQNFYTLYGLPTIGFRYFNVYGRRQDPDSVYAAVIPLFVKALLTGEAPLIYGDGEQSRDFTYVDDVVAANIAACTAKTEALGEVYNVACGDRTTVNQLFTAISDSLLTIKPDLKKLQPAYLEDRPGDIKHSLADTEKAERLLGHKYKFSLEQGLLATMQWYCDNI